jgi:pectin methylesterase-like acyl-CoA thioesterase
MKTPSSCQLVLLLLVAASFASPLPGRVRAAPWDPGAADYSGHKGKTLYVSKLGDDSDGSSWQKAFRTIQAAMQAVPGGQGGNRVIVRPDTYPEAIIYPSHDGASGAYNEDCDLMGYKVFGNSNNPKDPGVLSYTTKGKVQAYVQYEHSVPAGFQRMGLWPVDLVRSIAPPSVDNGSTGLTTPRTLPQPNSR